MTSSLYPCILTGAVASFIWPEFWVLVYTFRLFLILNLLPLVIYTSIALTSVFIGIWLRIFGPSKVDPDNSEDELNDEFRTSRDIMAKLWCYAGRIFYGYEIRGMENIPDKGGALMIYYHGGLPIDYYYLVSHFITEKKRIPRTVADKFVINIPILHYFITAFKTTSGAFENCKKEINDGRIVGIAPGGVYEALFSSNNYEVKWRERTGFARIALETGCPIIPMFTENVRETYFPVHYGFKKFFMRIYEKTKMPLVHIVGGFPVKMVTHIGEPIKYDPEMTPRELRDKIEAQINEMIQKHQKHKPGSIMESLKDRLFGLLSNLESENSLVKLVKSKLHKD